MDYFLASSGQPRRVVPFLSSVFSLLLVAAGCGGGGGACPTQQAYDPEVYPKVQLWPDPLFLDEDPTSPTGLQVNLDPARAAWVQMAPPLLKYGMQGSALNTGMARNGSVVFRFTRPLGNLPSTADESLSSEVVAFYDLSTTPATRVPFSVETLSNGKAVVLQPLVPLSMDADHLVVIADTVTDTNGGCVSPSSAMADLIAGTAPNPDFDFAVSFYASAFAAAGVDPSTVVAASAFHTQADQDAVLTAADTVDGESYAYAPGATTCAADPADANLTICDTAFEAIDFREPNGAVLTGLESARYTIPVRVWLPAGGGPFPVVMFGHGLGGNRTDGEPIAQALGAVGVATIADDALDHGDHPTAAMVTGAPADAFLGVDFSTYSFDTLALRGNFTQTYLDRLQMVRLFQQNTDVDGDMMADLDMTRFGYWGISLGGLLGPGLTALEPTVDAAVYTVGGGLLSSFVQNSDVLSSYLSILEAISGGPDELSLFMVVAQTLVDGADPATWADAVARRRLRGVHVPSVLLPTAESDTVVPPIAGRALARGLGAVQVRPISTVTPPLLQADAPLVGSSSDPIIGYFQFDRVGGQSPVPAGHSMFSSPECTLQANDFWAGWLAGAPEIINPYPAVGTPPL